MSNKGIVGRDCPECDGILRPRKSGFLACERCGRLVIPTSPNGPVVTGGRIIKAGEKVEPTAGDAPDFFEPMIGWRAWKVDANYREGESLPLLHSVTYGDYAWEPGQPVEAVCPSGHKGGPPCEGNCSCGLYAAKTYKHLMGMGYPSYDAATGKFCVVGEVSLWGKIVEGTQGWRAQVGYPRKLYVPFEAWRLAKPLHDAYGVPVKMQNFLKDRRG